MADRSISIALEAKVQGFVSGMRTAQQATTDFANRTAAFARENEQHLDRVGKASMVMGGALLAGIGVAVKSFMEFDSAMSEVQASTHETAGNMDLLRDAAINAGADTAFSAKEAAKGIDELAKAGVSTKDILGGGLTGALSLAAAGSLGVADAAEISATALTQFKLSGKDIPHIADLLAAGAGKAQGSVEDIGGALKQSGLVASQFGLSIEDTTGTLAAFASAGLIGSDAGTSLKSMLLKLAAPSKEAAGMMAELGIAAYDSNGAFVGVTGLAGQLKDKLGGLTQAQRDSTLATIFGTDAIRGANVLYEQGAKGVDGWIGKVNEAGYAAVTASIKQDNLAGDLEKLGGSFDSLLIKSGGGVAESLRGIVQGLEDMVDAAGKIPGPALSAGLGIAGVAGSALLVTGAFATLLPKFVEFKDSLDKIAPKGSKAAGVIGGIGKAAGVAAAAMTVLQVAGALFSEADKKSVEDYGQALLKVADSGKGIDASGLDKVFQGWGKNFGVESVTNVNNLSDAVREFANQDLNDQINKNFADPLNSLFGFQKTHIGQIADNFKKLGESMGGLVKNGSADTAAQSFKLLTKEFEKNGKSAQDALDALPGYKEALQGLANQAGVTIEGQDLLDFAMGKVPSSMAAATGAVKTYTDASGQVVPITPEVAKALEDIGLSAQGAVVDIVKFADAMLNAGLTQLSARDAARNFQAAIDAVGASVTANGTTLDINTDKGRANQAALDGIASAGYQVVKANAANGASQSTLQGNLTETYNRLIAGAGQFGITGQAAIDLARSILKVPPGVSIKSWMSSAAKSMAEQTAGAMNALDGKTVNTYVNTYETTFQKVLREISGAPAPGPVTQPGQAGYGVLKRAGGGPVKGPGTGTSDDIAAWLSNGEHVLTAAEVQKMGGQSAVYRFRDMLAHGKAPKFAAGGAAGYRRDEATKFYKDSRRGETYSTVAGSLSGAYSFADRLTGLADSGNVAAAAVRNLYQAAGQGESGLKRLFAQSDRLGASLTAAKARLDDLSQVRDGIGSSLSGEFSISDAMKNTSAFSAISVRGIQGAATSVLSRIRGFAAKLNKLRAMGYSGAVLQEIAGMGSVEGGVAADALLKGNRSEVKNLNGTYTAIDSASKAAGTYVTDAMYRGGVNAAAGLVKGLQSQEKAIEKQMLKIGYGMEAALKRALGIHSPSRKAQAIGDNFAGTLAARLAAGAVPVAKQAKALGDAMNVSPKGLKPAVTYRPVPAHAAVATAPSVYVQNPFTGEYLLARTATVATGVVSKADSQSQYTRTGRR